MPAVTEDFGGNPIAAACRKCESVFSYQVTLHARGNHFSEEVRYYFKSGCVRMEFISPFHGSVLTYNPSSKEVRLKPLPFLNHVIPLSPDSHMVRSSAGHRVDQSDIGSLLRAITTLQSKGKTSMAGDDVLSGRNTMIIRIVGDDDADVCGIHRYDLWLEKKTFLPLKVTTYNSEEELIEEVVMDDLEINVDLPDDLFRL
ncbi:MAG: DUF1571 domain-containing protein [Nitrospirae bacterium]|nr:DUF1571 domain-containing protein [Nitrospirota bacterium]